MKGIPILCGVLALALPNVGTTAPLSPIEKLGKSIFFDKDLSINGSQACADCHGPDAGWTGPLEAINLGGAVYEGAITDRFGNRKPPSSAYATPSPILHMATKGLGNTKRKGKGRKGHSSGTKALFVGGNFWDGRATGEELGNPAADQAQGPFLNPVEQASPDPACIVYKVCTATYETSFEQVWGSDVCDILWPADVDATCATEGEEVELSAPERDRVDQSYDRIALSIAAYEASPESNAFSSKYDAYLAGLVKLTKQERKGLKLFKGRAKCARCHTLSGKNSEPPLFTDYSFDNVGIPRNPENPWYDQDFNPEGEDWVDLGLGNFLEYRVDYEAYAAANYGKQKVPTLRNVDKRPDSDPDFVKAYGHNGYFKSLKGVVHFYNTRDVKPVCLDQFTSEADALAQSCWPEPEVALNVNSKELGNMKLSDAQEDAIVAFLKTLTDGYVVP